jgi:hypothetical protein
MRCAGATCPYEDATSNEAVGQECADTVRRRGDSRFTKRLCLFLSKGLRRVQRVWDEASATEQQGTSRPRYQGSDHKTDKPPGDAATRSDSVHAALKEEHS